MARPRKAEVTAVVAALETPADSPEEAAERAIQALDSARVGRPQYVVGTRVAGCVALVGPVATPHQAAKLAERMAGGPVDVSEGHGIYGIIPATSVTDPVGGECDSCGHPVSSHNWPRLSGAGCVVVLGDRRKFEPGARRAGTLDICPCTRAKF